mgnify:CR=1 FL=1
MPALTQYLEVGRILKGERMSNVGLNATSKKDEQIGSIQLLNEEIERCKLSEGMPIYLVVHTQ